MHNVFNFLGCCLNSICSFPRRKQATATTQGQISIGIQPSNADILKLDSNDAATPGTDPLSTTFITQNLVDDDSSKDSKPFELPAITENTA